MNGPFTALAWEYYRRVRRNFLLAAFWMAAGTLFFGYLLYRIGSPEVLRERGVVFILLMQLMASVPLLAAAQAEQRGKDNPMMPARWYRLPLSTPWLVGVQMLFGAAAMLLLWALVNIPVTGAVFGLWLPWQVPLFFVALLAVTQAFAWGMGGFVIARLIAAGVAVALFVDFFFDFLKWMLRDPRPSQHPEVTMIVLIILAFVMALLGVALDRRGVRWLGIRPAYDALTRRIATRRPSNAASPFASPIAAQFWYEWHTRGVVLPFLAVLMTVFMVGLRVSFPDEREIAPMIVVLSTWCFALVSYGVGFVAAGSWREGRVRIELPAFVAARPLAAGELGSAVLRACTASVLVSVVLLALCCLALLGPVGIDNILFDLGLDGASVAVRVLVVAGVIAAVACGSWVMFMLGMTGAATGRRWVGGAVGGLLFLIPVLMLTVSSLSGLGGTRAGKVLVYGGIVLPPAVAVIGCAALYIVAKRLGLIGGRAVLAGMLGAIILCGAFLAALLPSNWPQIVSVCFAVTVAALAVQPFAGIPAALHWNRHR